jgi:hypothetical protein
MHSAGTWCATSPRLQTELLCQEVLSMRKRCFPLACAGFVSPGRSGHRTALVHRPETAHLLLHTTRHVAKGTA